MYRTLLGLFVLFALIRCTEKEERQVPGEPTTVAFNLPDGFILEDLYHPSAKGQGSWVALANGPDNTLFACDQRGKIYTFKTPQNNQLLHQEAVDSLPMHIGQAQGLLWAHNSLFVAVNKKWDEGLPKPEVYGSGIYRITDTNADGRLDNRQLLLKLEGQGEHGPHSLVLGPDDDRIYFVAGNHTLIPERVLRKSRLPTNWNEDNLFEPYLDARGHANDIKAPGGWIAKFSPDGNEWELVSAGYRNPFDLAFNQHGELFTYDSDMEWDIGMPWYRPTRVCHVTSGSEYGWRTGSGKWPSYYPDNLPAVQNMQQGSPTAVLSTAQLAFPDHYGDGLLIADWSFGTMYFLDLIPKGSSYGAASEEFLSGTPLPLTDMIAGEDGALYFITGGRGLDSHLYRLRYSGDSQKEKATAERPEVKELRELRHRLEALHTKEVVQEDVIRFVLEHLDHNDRHIRYAARVALEHRPVNSWIQHFKKETNHQKIVEMGIALAHQGTPENQRQLLKKLNSVPLNSLSEDRKVDLLRAYTLSFIRQGNPAKDLQEQIVKKLRPYFPSINMALTRELAQLLLYLKAEGILPELMALLQRHTKEKTVADQTALLSEKTTLRSERYGPLIRDVIAKMPPSEAIFYGMLLSHADAGWTRELRENYFLWYYDVLGSKGCMSFKAYMENVRLKAMRQVPKAEQPYFQKLSGVYSPSTALADLPEPIGPGANYTGDDISTILWGGGMDDYQGSVEAGQRAYKAAMCVLCHRFRGEGGASGPDLTQVHTKFSSYEMLFAIFSPNDEISDQYAHTLLHLEDGKKVAGRVKSEKGDSITVLPNPFNETYAIRLGKNKVLKRELSPISPMPSGLLNRLNRQEVLDLFAYLQSGGDAEHEVYRKNKTHSK